MSERPSSLPTLAKRVEWTLLQAGPRWLLPLAAQVFGVWPVPNGKTPIPGTAAQRGSPGFLDRLRSLIESQRSPHPLFDPSYYTRAEGGSKSGLMPPFLHFLTWGGFERRKPHPLFDPHWYLIRYPDVANARHNPLQHYVTFGWREGRSPHPLFEPKWYTGQSPEARSSDPLVHFLLRGGAAGRKPHPLFDSAWYLRTYPEVKRSGLNPLVHYLLHGAAEGKNPNPHFDSRQYLETHPDAAGAGVDPLSHLVIETYSRRPGSPPSNGRALFHAPPAAAKPLFLSEHASRRPGSAPLWRNRLSARDCPVFVVYGQPNVEFIESHLLPALAAQQGSFRLHLHTLHYKNPDCLLSPSTLRFRCGNLDGVTDWSASRPDRHIGFGESVNYLFDRVKPKGCFLIVNPDSLPMAGCIEQMLDTFTHKPAALVEARQWPMEHPKEFNRATGETPWASGAFLLLSSEAFHRLDGFDPIYFLYNEDVDLSWRAWLAGMPVVYEPAAMCAHFTGALSRDFHRFRREQFFTIRNFLTIAYKFFGERGERIAQAWIRQANLPPSFQRSVDQSYLALRESVKRVDSKRVYHPEKIKILGMNLYHELRKN
jgi:hypothetical protein